MRCPNRPFHQANATVEALTAEMHNIHNDLREEMNSLSTFTPPTEVPSEQSPPPTGITPPANNQMNATTQQGQQAIIAAIQQLQQQFNNMNSTINNRITGGQNSGSTTGNGGINSGRNNGGNNQRFTRTNISKYCWSHGACAHGSSECNSKREGHKENATFENKQGGSTSYCGSHNA